MIATRSDSNAPQEKRKPRLLNPTKPPKLPRHLLPTMYDLPSEFPEELGLPDTYHDLQPQLLSETIKLQDYNEQEIFTGSDLNVYYDEDNRLWHKRPDWFLAVGISFTYYDTGDLRLSYVAWQEAVNPFMVVELISPGTEDEDFGRTVTKPGGPPVKWTVYEQILQIPYYIVFNRYSDELHIFKLENGQYKDQPLPDNRLWIPELNTGIGLWYGTYREGTHQEAKRNWLRWYDSSGQWMPTLAESSEEQIKAERQKAEAERQRAEAERQRAEAEKQRAEVERQQASVERQRATEAEDRLTALEAQLRAKGIDPNEFV